MPQGLKNAPATFNRCCNKMVLLPPSGLVLDPSLVSTCVLNNLTLALDPVRSHSVRDTLVNISYRNTYIYIITVNIFTLNFNLNIETD